MTSASQKSRQLVLLLATALGVVACSGDMDDLDAYINEIKARPGGLIEPLPEIKPYEVFTYVADEDGFRSPFSSFPVPHSRLRPTNARTIFPRPTRRGCKKKSPTSSATSRKKRS